MVSVHRLNLQQLTARSDFLKNHVGAMEEGKKDNRKERRNQNMNKRLDMIVLILKVLYNKNSKLLVLDQRPNLSSSILNH